MDYSDYSDEETITADIVLQNINYFVTIKEPGEYVEHYESIVEHILSEMEDNNSLFRALYDGYTLVGSYRDRLKVTKPDEFDVNICLKFKHDYNLVQVTPAPRLPGFCNINVRNCRSTLDNNNQMGKLLDREGYLQQDKVNKWVHNIFKNILEKYERCDDAYILRIDGHSYKLSFQLSGPAYTLKLIVFNSHIKFSVDLAIGFVFDNSKWVASRKPYKNNDTEWYAVPKPIQGNSKRSFICSYANMERKLMYNLNSMKCLLRLFKKLRDTHNLQNLISYHIKTVFLWEIKKNTPDYWEQSLIELFLDIFKKLLDLYRRQRLPSFWDPGYNLLDKFDTSALTELEGKLRSIHKQMVRNEERNPEYFTKVFLTSGEIKTYNRRY